jgi:replicative DNA helicase
LRTDEKVDFSKFGKSFQEKLCQLILHERSFADQIGEVLDYSFFELKHLQVFARKVYDYKKDYAVHPTVEIMTTVLRTSLDDENEATKQMVRDYFVRTMSSQVSEQESQYIKEQAIDFCRKQSLKKAMIKSVDLLHNSSFDEIAHLIKEAIKLGSDNDFGYDYLQDFEERFLKKARNPVSTGWSEIDAINEGGLGSKELGVVIAPTGAGKSMMLVHLGAEALKQGKNVVHYTLELSDTAVASRYDSCITGVKLGELFSFKDLIYDKIQNIEGKLIVKEYPTKSATPATIRAHLERIQLRGTKVDLVIVDYGDLLRPSIIRKEKRHELETIYEDLRAIGQDFKCPVWTASQTNRSGLNATVVTMEEISEAFNKCFVADFICTVSRTKDDKMANTGILFVAKNRNGPDGMQFPLFMDTSNVKIKVLEASEENFTRITTAREQKETLAEKYKKHRKDVRNV